ncbi:MAG: Ribosomal large subunit pseudouridine synthase D [Gemmatimonadaceae bacterium]|nr:Ribosomal large subunit pseudouridine synthase D [Gemmatimonadaceae bacterium]
MPEAHHEVTVEADSDVRLDLFVARWLGLSRTQAATLIATGCVLVDGRRQKASYRPEAGDHVLAVLQRQESRPVLGESIPLHIVFEDDCLLIVDKPAGMVVHPAPGNWTGTLVNALIGRTESLERVGPPERAGIVHRLDKDTSGLLLVAKSDRSHRLLSAALAARRITRVYGALSWGHLDQDRVIVDRPLARDPRDRTRMAVVQTGKAARTTFVRLARFDSVDLLRAHLHTGRTHQIRVHLASLGHPVVGDDTYGGGGGRRAVHLPTRRQFLHAAWMRFLHPETGQQIDVRSPLPEDLRASLAHVANTPSLIAHLDPLDVFDFYQLAATT